MKETKDEHIDQQPRIVSSGRYSNVRHIKFTRLATELTPCSFHRVFLAARVLGTNTAHGKTKTNMAYSLILKRFFGHSESKAVKKGKITLFQEGVVSMVTKKEKKIVAGF